MTAVLKLWPLLTATHRYDKTLSTRNRGAGTTIEAPILAYLIETTHGRVLYADGKNELILRQALDFELSFGRRITSDTWKIELSTLPWRQGFVMPLGRN